MREPDQQDDERHDQHHPDLESDGQGPDDRAGIDVRQARRPLAYEIAQKPARFMRMVDRGAGSGDPLDATTRAYFERRLGADLGRVRVYTGELAEEVTRQHGAEAVTIGGTGMILMGGRPERSPVTASGRALLAHELTHVAQSTRGIYRSAPGQRPPLATAEHEAEAEAVEAAELAAETSAATRRPDPSGAEFEQLVIDRVVARVLALIDEDDRVSELRSGPPRMRP